MKWLALALLVPALASAQVRVFRPGTAPQITSTVASGGDGLRLVQGAGVCFNSTTCTTRISYDGTDFIIDVPASKGFQIEVNGTDVFTVSSAGTVTSAIASGSNAFAASTGARWKIGGGTTDYFTSNGTTEITAAGAFRSTGTFISGNGNMYTSASGVQFSMFPNAANNASAIGFRLGNVTNLTTDGAKIVGFYSNEASTLRSAVAYTGELAYNTGGADDVAGRAVLVGGTVTVSTTAVETDSIILLTRCATGGTEGTLRVGTVTADTSFVIESTNGSDTSTVCWQLAQQF